MLAVGGLELDRLGEECDQLMNLMRPKLDLHELVPTVRRGRDDQLLSGAGPDRVEPAVLIVVKLDRSAFILRHRAQHYPDALLLLDQRSSATAL